MNTLEDNLRLALTALGRHGVNPAERQGLLETVLLVGNGTTRETRVDAQFRVHLQKFDAVAMELVVHLLAHYPQFTKEQLANVLNAAVHFTTKTGGEWEGEVEFAAVQCFEWVGKQGYNRDVMYSQIIPRARFWFEVVTGADDWTIRNPDGSSRF